MKWRALVIVLASLTRVAFANAQPQTTPGVVRGDRVLTDNATEPRVVDPRPPLAILPGSDDALMDPRMARSWSVAPYRPFIATTVDVGFIYLRPRLSLGYGKPFTMWVGIDANPIVQSSGLGAYGGLRFEFPYADLRIGPRYFYSFSRSILDVKNSYDRLEIESDAGKRTQIITYESELDAAIPVGPGSILLRGSVSNIKNLPNDKAGFEETLRVIVRPPWVWRGRIGYALRLGSHSQHSVGWVVDALDVPKRDDSLTIRTGPLLKMVLSRRVEIRGSFVMTIVSPDHLGLVGGDFSELGVRYRWASEPSPARPVDETTLIHE